MKDAQSRAGLRAPASFRQIALAECEQPIHRRFEQQVTRSPDAPAVCLPTGALSYAALDARANAVAVRLAAATGAPGRPVALLFPQGLSFVVATLAALKAGHPVAPLDRRLPEAALQALLADLDPAAIVAAGDLAGLAARLAGGRRPVLVVDDDAGTGGADPGVLGSRGDIDPREAAFVFYTSGSTGMPKGVADAHRNVLHNVRRYTNTLRFGPGDRMSMVQNPSFSGINSSLFGALLTGAAVAPCDLDEVGLPRLSEWVRAIGISVFHGVPSIVRQLHDPVGRFPSVRVVRLEGDRGSAQDVAHFRANFGSGCTLVNGFGATECGLARQFFVGVRTAIDPSAPLPIGYEVPDTVVRVVDADGADVAAGAVGEMVVESDFLALGYWLRPELTARRFVTLPGGRRRYRTGDLARIDADGCVTHLGRTDHRVRIAGRFVDVEATERALRAVPGVAQAIVGDVADSAGESRLAAWIVPAPGAAPTVEVLRAAAAQASGPSDAPARYVLLDALPLTRDGKVDRARLPAPARERPALRHAAVPPSNGLERRLAAIWSAVLELDAVGVTDSFLDLGGDSLTAARIAARCGELGYGSLRVATLFEHPTIEELARALDAPRQRGEPAATAKPDRAAGHRIAIIGMAVRLPGADDVDAFWSNLAAGRESLTVVGDEGPPGNDANCSAHTAARGLLAEVLSFDAALFGLTPRQAQMLDPQQRVWLECAYRALEDAGLPAGGTPPVQSGPVVGVFAGCRESTYLWDRVGGDADAVAALLAGEGDDARELTLGNDRDTLAPRTSYLLGLRGPSVGVQTACSTSLVAVAQACEALASGRCDIALAGGVTVAFPQQHAAGFLEGGIHSRDGHCRPFDADATGTVFGDGAGAVVLRRLDDALASGDRILAVIRGWAVNNDGGGKASFAAPSIDGQEAVIRQAQQHAGVRADEVSYVEAHGTGTPVGDPIEFAGLVRAFRRDTDAVGFCGLGSVKSNVGHLDAAAGVAGLVKTVLALLHRELPATLHFRTPNPELELAASPFFIVDRHAPWDLGGRSTRIAGVTALGIGGTNCHVVVEEAPLPEARAADGPDAGPCLIPLSAASADALATMEANFADFLAGAPAGQLPTIAATAQRSRSRHAFRSAFVGAGMADLRRCLRADRAEGGDAASGEAAGAAIGWRPHRTAGSPTKAPRIAFVFGGQGTGHPAVGQELYAACAEFRDRIDHCAGVLRDRLERPLQALLFDPLAAVRERTDVAQPLLVALELAVAQVLRGWGVVPRFVLGHSLGEYVAACVAGVFDPDEALRLAAVRGHLMQSLPGSGRMLAVGAGPSAVAEFLAAFGGTVAIAAVNSPTQTVVAGESGAIDRFAELLRTRGVPSRPLRAGHAFHSAQMDPVLAPLEQAVARCALAPPALGFASNLRGAIVGDEATTPAYWSSHCRAPVQFAAGVGALLDAGCDAFVEIGPLPVLGPLIREAAAARSRDVAVIPALVPGDDAWRTLQEALARLHVAGANIDWTAFQHPRRLPTVRLPSYPFQRVPHEYRGALARGAVSAGPARASAGTPGVDGVHPLLGRRLRLPGSHEIRFEARYTPTRPHYLADHRLFGVPLPPGASHFALLAQAARSLAARPDAGPGAAGHGFRFSALHLLRPLLLPEGCERDVQLVCTPERAGWRFALVSADACADDASTQAWTTHLVARGSHAAPCDRALPHEPVDLDALRARCPVRVAGGEFYARIWANQGGTGSSFRWIDTIWQGEREALCRAVRPAAVRDAAEYALHPGLIEAACQVLHCCGAIETQETIERGGQTWVPFAVDAFSVGAARPADEGAWCHARLRSLGPEGVVGDLAVFADDGTPVAMLEGFCLRPITRAAVRALQDEDAMAVRPVVDADDGEFRAAPVPGIDPAAVLSYVRRRCAELSGHPAESIDADVGFVALGLDSIAAVRLANDLDRAFGRYVPAVRILAAASLRALAEAIAAGEPTHGRPVLREARPADPR